MDTAYGNSYKGQTFRQQTGSLWASFQTKRTLNISMLSYFLTYSILLSTSRRLVPLSREGNVLQASLYLHKVVSTIHHRANQTIRRFRRSDFRRSTQACFPLFKQGGINYPPSALAYGPPFSPERSCVLQVFRSWTFCILHIFLIKTRQNEIFHKSGKSRFVIPFDSIGRTFNELPV